MIDRSLCPYTWTCNFCPHEDSSKCPADDFFKNKEDKHDKDNQTRNKKTGILR